MSVDNDNSFQFLMEQMDELKNPEEKNANLTVEKFLDAGKNTIICETQNLSDQKIVLLATKQTTKLSEG